MSNNQESPLITAIRGAAYADLNHLASLYQRTEDIGDCLSHFSEVFDKVNKYLEGMAERSLRLIVTYSEQLEKNVSQCHLMG